MMTVRHHVESMRPEDLMPTTTFLCRLVGIVFLLSGCAGGGETISSGETGEIRSSSVPRSGARIKVLSYNIHHGEGTDRRLDLPRIAAVIRRTGADIVALQEVDSMTRRSRGIHQTKVLAEAVGWQHHAFVRAMPYQGGDYGEAILSRFPIFSPRPVPLVAPPGEEPRTAIEVVIQPWGDENASIRFVGTHLSHESTSTRLHQVAALKSSLEGDVTPIVLAGDFNFIQKSGPYRLISEGWLDAARKFGRAQPTFPSRSPDRRIDYVFVRPAHRWRVISAEVISEPIASDHCPLLVELELLPPTEEDLKAL